MNTSGDEPKRRLRDVDSARVAMRIKAMAFSLFAAIPAMLLGSHFGAGTRAPLLVTIVWGAAGFGVAYFVTLGVADALGRAAGGLYFGSGRSTAGRREYSLAESLIARGRLDEAVVELEKATAVNADDPWPPMRLARLLRDQCERPEEAVRWFRIAIARSSGDAAAEIGVLREIVEIYTHVLRTPRRAMPDLARLASRHPDTAAGAWARREMTHIRQSMQEEDQA